jgi:hypothetical protein
MRVNWRRGLFRVWLVLSLVWITFSSLIAYSDLESIRFRAVQRKCEATPLPKLQTPYRQEDLEPLTDLQLANLAGCIREILPSASFLTTIQVFSLELLPGIVLPPLVVFAFWLGRVYKRLQPKASAR